MPVYNAGMEQFDLVDENDNVIGVTDKATAHAYAHIHRIAAVYVFDQQGRLYVQEHIKSGGRYDHSVGGHVRKGESYADAAKREAMEELGISDPLHEISVFYSDETGRGKPLKHMFALYECTPSQVWSFTPNEEVKHIFPMAIADIVELMNTEPLRFTMGFIHTMQEYLKKKASPLKISVA